MMLGASLSSFIFVLASSLTGMPISTTHSDIGALIGAGLAGVGADNLSFVKIQKVVGSWFVSPLVSGSIAAAIFTFICYTTIDCNFSA